MAVAAIIATALTDRSTRTKSLTVAGVDMIHQPGTYMGYGVRLESVSVTEEGSGAAGSLTFVIDDPNLLINMNDGDPVCFQDVTNNFPIFTGWVQTWSIEPAFGERGRQITVTAIGADALLDWAYVPAICFLSGTALHTAIQGAVGQAIGVGPLRAFANTGGSSEGSQDAPVGFLTTPGITGGTQCTTGGTLRETIRQILGLQWIDAGVAGPLTDVQILVDAFMGLRVFRTRPSDWNNLTVINDAALAQTKTEKLSHEIDAVGIPRSVQVVGGNAAGTGLVSDGTGKIGPIAVLNDSTILTSAAMQTAGAAYLASFAASIRGTFNVSDWDPTPAFGAGVLHAGGLVVITDARVGLNAVSYRIATITKSFHAVREDWSIAYGGRVPSAISSIRRLTRNTLS